MTCYPQFRDLSKFWLISGNITVDMHNAYYDDKKE